ncbi:MAG: choice-of-anchor M domain-containing protein, partial [Acidimicrobiia bacterium]
MSAVAGTLALGLVAAVAAGPATAAVAAAGPATGGAPAGHGPVPLVAAALDGADRLQLRIRGAGGGDGAPVAMTVDAGSAGAVPPAPGFEFLGPPGRPLWILSGPEGALATLDATGVPAARVGARDLTLTLVEAAGPGTFWAYALSPTGVPTPLLGSGVAAARSTRVAAGRPAGPLVWAFDAPGTYRLTLEAEVTLAGGGVSAGRAGARVDVPAAGDHRAAATDPPPVPVGGSGAAAAPLGAPPGEERAMPPTAATGFRAATNRSAVVVSSGHVDIGPRLIDGAWRLQVRDDRTPPPVWRDLEDVVLHVVDQARIAVPPGNAFSFLGPAGAGLWMLPQTERPGVLWPGWNTQDVSVTTAVAGPVTWTMEPIGAPGSFSLFFLDPFGTPRVLFDGSRPFPQATTVPHNTHAHGNWAFGAGGSYCLAVTMTAASGTKLTDRRILEVSVGGPAPRARSCATTSAGTGVAAGPAGAPGAGGDRPAGEVSIEAPVPAPVAGDVGVLGTGATAAPGAGAAGAPSGRGGGARSGALAVTGRDLARLVAIGLALVLAG